MGGAPNKEIWSIIQQSRSAPQVGLVWSAKDRIVEKGGLVPPNEACWNNREVGCQLKYMSCATTHERGCFKPHTDNQIVWLGRQFGLVIKIGSYWKGTLSEGNLP